MPNIFMIPSNRWSDRTSGSDVPAEMLAADAARPGERWFVLGAAALAWGLVGGLLWLAA